MGFKYLNKDHNIFDGDDSDDVYANEQQLQSRLDYFEKQLAMLAKNAPADKRIQYLLEIGRVEVERYQGAKAWESASEAFDLAKQNDLWEKAVEACDIMFLSAGPDALKALGHGLWLGITFPIDPEITVAMLQHLVEESPESADTRAVAAAAAHYVASIRCDEEDDLTFFTLQMLTNVADKHSHITDQTTFDVWRKTLGLDKPEIFLAQLSNAINQLVGDQWWIDKDRLTQSLDNKTTH